MKTSTRSRLLPVIGGSCAALALCGPVALAGGGPESALLIINPADPVSMHLGNYYKNARGIPDSAVLYMNPDAPNHAAFAQTHLPALFGHLAGAGTAGHTDFIILAPGAEFFMPRSGPITDDCSPVNRIAIASAYTMAFIADEVLAGTKSTLVNTFFSTGTNAAAFDSDLSYLAGKASNDPAARRYYIGALLGYTGERGNTPAEIRAMIDRAVAADGQRPPGTFYFMNNPGDAPRNVRAPSFNAVVTALVGLGFAAQKVDGILPLGNFDALGIMTGAANPNIDSQQYGMTGAPFADHLTSYAGTFDNDSQTKMSRWIANGAVGSVGATEEPCNYQGKFPHARLHLFYAQGATLAEAYFRSITYVPFQMLFMGDPLARPFAWIPEVIVPDAPEGPVSGTIELSPIATTDRPDTLIALIDIQIDGVAGDFIFPGQKFSIDTTELADGFHEVRIIAVDSTAVRTQGAWTGLIEVDNRGLLAVPGPETNFGNLGTRLGFDLSAEGAPVKEIRLIHAGRVVAAAQGPAGHVNIYGQNLGAGHMKVQAEALFGNGQTARSAPVTLDISFDGGGPGAEPVAFGYTKVVKAPQSAVLVELPAAYTDNPATAVTTVLSLPQKADVLLNDGSPYILIQPDPGVEGTDTLSFRVQTPSGMSNTATVIIDYGSEPSCPPDLNGDGSLDLFDFLEFSNLFNAQDPEADCAGDGEFDLFDFLCFVNLFNEGC